MSEQVNLNQEVELNNESAEVEIVEVDQTDNPSESSDESKSGYISELVTEEDKLVEDTNSIELVGTVISAPVYSHEYDDNSFYSLLMRVVRPYNKKKFDDIHVFIRKEDLFQGEDKEIVDKDTRLQVFGHIVQSKLHNKFDISVVALTAKVVDETVKDKNRLKISGNISKLFDRYDVEGTSYVVKSLILSQTVDPTKKYKLTIKLSAWNTTVHHIERNFNEGDRVFVAGQLTSKLVKVNDDTNDDYKIILHEGMISVIEPIHDDESSDNN